MAETGNTGFFPYTPATNLLYGLREALHDAARRGGAATVFRAACAARRGDAARGRGWGLEMLCADPREYSNSLTAVLVPEGYDADRVREIILDALRHVARHRARQDAGQDLPHRPSRPFQRSDAVRHAVRRRDGAAPRRHPAPRAAASRRRSNISARSTAATRSARNWEEIMR